MKDLFVPPTPAAAHPQESLLERSASIVRHVAPEDPYHDYRPDSRIEDLRASRLGHRPTPSAPATLSASVMRPALVKQESSNSLAQSRYGSVTSLHSYPEHNPAGHYAPSRPESRILSHASSVSAHSNASSGYTAPTTVSGSENWETYSSASASDAGDLDREADASAGGIDTYYAKLRASQYAQRGAAVLGKRPGTASGYASPRLGMGKKLRGNGETLMEVRGEDGRLEMVRVRESEESWADE